MEMTEQEEHEIRQYVESQTSDPDNEVQLVQRVGRRRIAGYESSLRIQVLPYLRDVNRPGFPGGSKPWKGWSHGTRAPRIEAVPA